VPLAARDGRDRVVECCRPPTGGPVRSDRKEQTFFPSLSTAAEGSGDRGGSCSPGGWGDDKTGSGTRETPRRARSPPPTLGAPGKPPSSALGDTAANEQSSSLTVSSLGLKAVILEVLEGHEDDAAHLHESPEGQQRAPAGRESSSRTRSHQ
jgi:hypothetical protein